MPRGVYTRTDAYRKKMSEAHKKITNSGRFKKGQHPSPETEFKNGGPKPEKAYVFPKGEKSYNWNNNETITNGYVYIFLPRHHAANSKGYTRRSRVIMEQHLGRLLSKDELVHHINGNTADDRIENLKLFESQSAHSTFHCKLRREAARKRLPVKS